MVLNFKLGNRGQTIIEAAVALSILMLILASVAIAIATSLSNSEFTKNQSLASRFAEQGMESVRYMRNNCATTFNGYAQQSVQGTQAYCMPPSNNLDACTISIGSPQARCGVVSDFGGVSLVREIVFAAGSNDCSEGTRVTVNVYWSSGKCSSGSVANRYCHKVQLVSCFADQSISGKTL